MPELPDIDVYVTALGKRLVGARLEQFKLSSPFVLRSVEPSIGDLLGSRVLTIERLGKRIVFGFEGELFAVVHLMRLGRFRWAEPGQRAKHASGKVLLATLEFDRGTLHVVEMGPKKRAAIHVCRGRKAVSQFHAGGLEVLVASLAEFEEVVRSENHTLKRTLTDPRLLSGIGNAYSDEILHAARLSPVKLSSKLSAAEIERLYAAAREILVSWRERLARAAGDGFPEKVTAFHSEMAVHGRYRKPCPVCGDPVQRIVYADRETNYCATCQTGGRPLADRALSRLLGKDWPKSLEELEERRGGAP